MLNQQVSQKLLLEALAGTAPSGNAAEALEFVLTRYADGKTMEIAAGESTPLAPGDVITVRLKPVVAPGADTSAIPTGMGSLPVPQTQTAEKTP